MKGRVVILSFKGKFFFGIPFFKIKMSNDFEPQTLSKTLKFWAKKKKF